MTKIETKIIEIVEIAVNSAFPGLSASVKQNIYLEIPKEKKFGDFSTNIGMRACKEIRKKPMEIAEILLKEIKGIVKKNDLEAAVSGIKIEPPGFINFYLSDLTVIEALEEIFLAGDKYGSSKEGIGRKIQIEFVSANPTGPLTVAHGRQAAIGDSLANILKFCGYDVDKEYYINDDGVQIQALGKSVKARLMESCGEKADFPENGYKGEYIYEIAKMLKEKNDIDVKALPKDEFFMEESAREIMQTIIRDLEDFGVKFDIWYSQKSLSKSGKIEAVLNLLRTGNFLYEQDGATWFKSTAFGDDKDRVLIKSDKTYTYITPDIAYHKDKFERGYDKIVNIWGPDHHGYINRIKAACQALGYDKRKLVILIAQLVTLYRDGKLVRMSTREGEFVTLREVIDEVGKDAARVFFIMRKVESLLDFDLELAKAKTADNPVFYIQYAYARISSVFKFSGDSNRDLKNLRLLNKQEEIGIIKLLMQYPNIIQSAKDSLEPYVLFAYLQDLSKSFHSYYDTYRIVTEDELLTKARVSLMQAVRTVLSSGLNLLGVSTPEKM